MARIQANDWGRLKTSLLEEETREAHCLRTSPPHND